MHKRDTWSPVALEPSQGPVCRNSPFLSADLPGGRSCPATLSVVRVGQRNKGHKTHLAFMRLNAKQGGEPGCGGRAPEVLDTSCDAPSTRIEGQGPTHTG
jgi:hypothetical protein